jgi:hypothetical protein
MPAESWYPAGEVAGWSALLVEESLLVERMAVFGSGV